jgi:hypothetical protein
MIESMTHKPAMDNLRSQLAAYPTLMDAYGQVEPIILQLFGAQRMSLFQRRRQHQDLVARFKTGKETRQIKVPISPSSIAGYVALAQRPLVIDDPYNADALASVHPRLRFAGQFDKSGTFVTQNILCVPVINADVLMGVMQIINKTNASFDDNDIELAVQVARVLGDKFRYELGGTKHQFEYLIHRGLTSQSTIDELSDNDASTKQIIQRLISEHRIPEEEIGNAISVHYQVPFITYLPDKYHLYQSDSKLNVSYLKRNHVAVVSDANDI